MKTRPVKITEEGDAFPSTPFTEKLMVIDIS
jgi:hypothetical protein